MERILKQSSASRPRLDLVLSAMAMMGAEWGIVNKTWDRACFRLFMAFLKK